MSYIDEILVIKENAKSDYAQRVAAELIYALELSKVNNGAFDDILKSSTHLLYDFLNENGAITNEAAKKCEEMLLPISNEAKKQILYCVSHAHIDMNWMWGFNETVAITLDTFRTVLNLMDEYPQFKFSQSQASTYKIVEDYDPGMFKKIKARVAEGRWEVSASTWVEADKNMPSGESLSRQILYTKRYFSDKFGLNYEDLELDFEPDTFGHNASVPEILSKGKIKYYYHCRGYEEHNIYNWRSPSGESILVYREPVWYNSQITPDLLRYVPEFCNKNDIDFALCVYGIGDHGGGPTRNDIERIIDMSEWPIAPTIKFGTYIEFFKQLEEYKHKFPIVDGELNYVFTGCFSSQSRIKMANRTAENDLFTAETATAISVNYANGENYSQNYQKAWEKTLFNQFHDILPGSGVRETREYAMGLFQDAIGYTYAGRVKAMTEIAQNIDTSSISSVCDKFSLSEGGGVGFKGCSDTNSSNYGINNNLFPERGNGKIRILHIFNPTQYEREETTEITIWDYPGNVEQLCITDVYGNKVMYKLNEVGGFWQHKFYKIFITAKVKPFGYNTYIITEAEKSEYQVSFPINPCVEHYPVNVLENDFIKAEFNENMILVSLTDKKTGKKLINDKSAYFEIIEQNHRNGTSMLGSAWVESFTMRETNLNETELVYVLDRSCDNPIRQFIRYNIPFKASNLTVMVYLDKDSDILKFKIDCDWHEIFSDKTGIPALRFYVPFGYKAEEYTYQIPFGTIKRKSLNHDVPSIGFAYAENNAGDKGIALLTDSIYAFRGENNSLSITMLRATQYPDQVPEYGLHTFNIGIAISNNDKHELFNKNCCFSYPLYYFSNQPHKGILPMENSFFKTEGSISVSAVKMPEDENCGFIIRVFDISQNYGTGCISFEREILSAKAVDLLEMSTQNDITVSGASISFNLKPNEILTLKIELK